jgi:hypothetical protein
MFKSSIFALWKHRQKKNRWVIQKDLVTSCKVKKNGVSNLIISVSKVTVTRLICGYSLFKRFPQEQKKFRSG